MGPSPFVFDRRTFLKVIGAVGGATAMGGLAGGWGGRALGQAGPGGTDPVVALADELENDPERIFRHVTDEIVYDAYEGALRGPAATLMGGAGNSVDQALLLAALLEASLVPSRFVTGVIAPDVAVRITSHRPTGVDEERERSAARLLPPEVAAAWTGPGGWPRLPETDTMFQQAAERVIATVDLVSAALEGAGVRIADTPQGMPAGELDAHVWVQYRSGTDWIDLDPSVPGAQPGTAYASPTATLESVPDDRYQTVTVRLVAEVVRAGVPTRTEVLTHTLRPADLAGIPVYLVHAPGSWLDIGGVLTGQERYQPTLLIDDEVVRGSTISLARGEGIDDIFGEETDAEGEALAEWIETDVSVPGAPVRTSERLLFDRVPPDQRASGVIDLAGLPPVELVELGDLGKVFRPLAGTTLISVVGGHVSAASFSQADQPTQDELVRDSAFTWQHLRDLLAIELVDRVALTSWPDEPVVAVLRTVPTPGTANGTGSADTVIDLHASHRRPLVLEGAAPIGAPGIVAGAIDHAAERMIATGAAILATPGEDPVETSVGRVFELAAEAGIPTRVLTPDEAVDIEGLAPGTLALIAAAQAGGRYLVMPAEPVSLGGRPRIGWWEFDPATGSLLDRLDDGGRAVSSEYAALVRFFTIGACAFAALGVITFIAKLAQGKLSTLTDFADALASAGGGAAGCAAGGFALAG
jgi:transglutaminase-like putative cysteine protease